jgi:hypothetical protein
VADANRAEENTEKKVSRFEGDIDLQGIDEADLAAQEAGPDAAEEVKEEGKDVNESGKA